MRKEKIKGISKTNILIGIIIWWIITVIYQYWLYVSSPQIIFPDFITNPLWNAIVNDTKIAIIIGSIIFIFDYLRNKFNF